MGKDDTSTSSWSTFCVLFSDYLEEIHKNAMLFPVRDRVDMNLYEIQTYSYNALRYESKHQ